MGAATPVMMIPSTSTLVNNTMAEVKKERVSVNNTLGQPPPSLMN